MADRKSPFSITHRADGGVDLEATTTEGVVLTFTKQEWDAFVAGVKDGEFHPSEHGTKL